MDVEPAPVRTVMWNGIEILAPDSASRARAHGSSSAGRHGVYPITTHVGVFDRPTLVVEPCPSCDATGVQPVAKMPTRS